MNSAQLIGRLTANPELKYTAQGTAYAQMTVAISRKGKDGQDEADFIPVVAWKQSAEFIAQYTGKGDLVSVEGSIRVRQYDTPEGVHKTFTSIQAFRVDVLETKAVREARRAQQGGQMPPQQAPPSQQQPPTGSAPQPLMQPPAAGPVAQAQGPVAGPDPSWPSDDEDPFRDQ